MTFIIAPTTPEYSHLPWVDYSTLAAVNMCPRWGLIHAYHGKRFSVAQTARAMPLEAGRAMHDVFAAVRMFDLMQDCVEKSGEVNEDMWEYGSKLFTTDRWATAYPYFRSEQDAETRCMQFALSLLETSGFHDHPDDNKRTQSNLEVAAINYVQRYPLGRYLPVYNYNGIHIGIEVPFDVTLRLGDAEPHVRLVGRCDALCFDTLKPNKALPELHENKTGSRIDTVWSSSFDTSHQVTTYLTCISALIDVMLEDAVIWGLQLPVPKSSIYGDGTMRYPTSRDASARMQWSRWVNDTLAIIGDYKDDPWNATMYTHSCNRYFRACSFIPLCVETQDMRKHIFEREMVEERWNPLAGIEPTLQVD